MKDNLDRQHSVKEAEAYNIYCAVCHQRNGLGNDRFPPLLGSEWVTGDKNVLMDPVNRPVADLWVTVQKAMGIQSDVFGDPKWSTGPLTELWTPTA